MAKKRSKNKNSHKEDIELIVETSLHENAYHARQI